MPSRVAGLPVWRPPGRRLVFHGWVQPGPDRAAFARCDLRQARWQLQVVWHRGTRIDAPRKEVRGVPSLAVW